MTPYTLLVAHRLCPVLARTAVGFTSKADLVRASLASLATALRTAAVRTKVVFILDAPPPPCESYDDLIHAQFGELPLVEYEIERHSPALGNRGTYRRQVEIFTADSTASLFYFSEDDYLYRPDAFVKMIAFIRQPGVDFITPLDHPDRYRKDALITQPFTHRVRFAAGHHWMSVENTCLTFLTTRETFAKTRKTLVAFADGEEDWSMWLGLTKKGVWRLEGALALPFAWLFGGKSVLRYYLPLIAWRRHLKAILFSPRYTLWQPIPSLAAHLCSESLPPLAEDFVPDDLKERIKSVGDRYLGLT